MEAGPGSHLTAPGEPKTARAVCRRDSSRRLPIPAIPPLRNPAPVSPSTGKKLLDYGFRSLHVTVETAKLLARTYYGNGPTKSYYEGCSQGGRQGLTLAQRFPNDFDGIVAGSPALYQTGTHLSRAYWMQGLNANPFPAAKLGLLAQRVYDQCDAKDGLKDGLIDDPRRCDFKPARDLPRCVDGSGPGRLLHGRSDQGARSDLWRRDESGKALFPGLAGGRGDRRRRTDRAAGSGSRSTGRTAPERGRRTGTISCEFVLPGAKAG